MGTVTERQVAHIWRRLGFGPTEGDINHGVAVGTTALINELLGRRPTTPAQWRLPQLSTWNDQAPYLGRQLELMATSANPLQERLAWILQGIVVVGVTDSVAFEDLRGHLDRLRVNPFGSYTRLLRDTAVLPGMMKYLNGDENAVGHPNQNYARELMELFSLGLANLVTGRPNYTQHDVVQIARALTGYTLNWTTGKIEFDPTQFDHGQKRFFGINQGDANLGKVITAVSRHPAYRYFIPARLYRELVGLEPDVATLRRLGALWGTAGDVRAVVRAIAHSPAFLAPSAIGSRVKSPIELLASGARVMGFPLASSNYGWQLSSFMNQNPFFPQRRGMAGGDDVAERRGRHDLGRHRPGLRRGRCRVDHRHRGEAVAARVTALGSRGRGPALRHHGRLGPDREGAPRVHDQRVVGSVPRGRDLGARLGLP